MIKKLNFLQNILEIYRNSQHNLVSDEGELPASHMFAHRFVRSYPAKQLRTYPLYNDEIYAWLTFAENPDSFKKQIVDIRSWLIPNYGWEDKHSLVTQSNQEGSFKQEILQFSPHGYYR